MSGDFQVGDLAVEIGDDFVALAEIRRPPNNFFDRLLIENLADAFERLDADPACRAIVLAAAGKHFCAGANFSGDAPADRDDSGRHLYDEAVRLFATRTPVVAAVHGAAIGGGLGLALMPDFRIACAEARFSANFARLGFHHGFGLSVTLPRLVGQQAAAEILYTGRRLKGDEAHRIGLCDRSSRRSGCATRRGGWPRRSPSPLPSPSTRSARPCAAISAPRSAGPPTARRPSRTACARPPTSPRVRRPWPNGGPPRFEGR